MHDLDPVGPQRNGRAYRAYFLDTLDDGDPVALALKGKRGTQAAHPRADDEDVQGRSVLC
ncbi:hypothetical protein GCM10027512_01800 [Chromohalobacter beijerinckii]